MDFVIGLIVGVIVGGVFGAFIMALFVGGKHNDK